jgi:hypothetical protein
MVIDMEESDDSESDIEKRMTEQTPVQEEYKEIVATDHSLVQQKTEEEQVIKVKTKKGKKGKKGKKAKKGRKSQVNNVPL